MLEIFWCVLILIEKFYLLKNPQKVNKQNICDIAMHWLFVCTERDKSQPIIMWDLKQFNGIFKCMKRLSFLLKSFKNNSDVTLTPQDGRWH